MWVLLPPGGDDVAGTDDVSLAAFAGGTREGGERGRKREEVKRSHADHFIWVSPAFRISAPTGRHSIAQGNALGWVREYER